MRKDCNKQTLTDKTTFMKRESTNQEKEVFQYLNELRESGQTNMFRAAPFIMEEFPFVEKKEARSLLSLWMANYNSEGEYETIEDKNIPETQPK